MNPRPPILVATPCALKWSDLAGGEKRRFCEQCQKHVHNLSAMSHRERDRLVTETEGQACVAYFQKPDGSLVTFSRWDRLGRFFRAAWSGIGSALAALLPFLLSGCSKNHPQDYGSRPDPEQIEFAGNAELTCTVGELSTGQAEGTRTMSENRDATSIPAITLTPLDTNRIMQDTRRNFPKPSITYVKPTGIRMSMGRPRVRQLP